MKAIIFIGCKGKAYTLQKHIEKCPACGIYETEHCKECAEVCRACAEECSAMAA